MPLWVESAVQEHPNVDQRDIEWLKLPHGFTHPVDFMELICRHGDIEQARIYLLHEKFDFKPTAIDIKPTAIDFKPTAIDFKATAIDFKATSSRRHEADATQASSGTIHERARRVAFSYKKSIRRGLPPEEGWVVYHSLLACLMHYGWPLGRWPLRCGGMWS